MGHALHALMADCGGGQLRPAGKIVGRQDREDENATAGAWRCRCAHVSNHAEAPRSPW